MYVCRVTSQMNYSYEHANLEFEKHGQHPNNFSHGWTRSPLHSLSPAVEITQLTFLLDFNCEKK